MIFGFGGNGRFQAARPPLARVIVSLRYSLVAALSSLPAIAPIQGQLADLFSELRSDELSQLEITINPAIAGVQQQQAKQPIWRFSGNEAGYEVIITPSATQVTVGQGYRDRQQFEEILRRVCDALKRDTGITQLDSFGVRYVNAIPVEEGWEIWWNPAVLGWLTSPDLHAQQIVSMSQTALTGGSVELENNVQMPTNAIVRHGLVPGVGPDLLENGATTKSYIVDCELAIVQPIAFAPQVVSELFRQYNHEIARFFAFALSEEGKKRFAVKAID